MTTTHRPVLSVIVATRNEELYIGQCLRSVLDGTLPASAYEVIVVDGQSADRTREIVERLMQRYPQIRWVDNPRRITPVAFNLGLKTARGTHVFIFGAHSHVDPDYLQVCLETLHRTGADAAGGRQVGVPANDSAQARLAMAALNSRFGAARRTHCKEGFSDVHGPVVYRRHVFERIGLFDEELVRNQDNELLSRLRAAGMRIWMAPQVCHYYYGRATVGKMLRQNLRNGLYGALTWRINPASFSLRHAIPFLFVLFLVLGGVASLLVPVLKWSYLGVIGLYVLLDLLASIEAGLRDKSLLALWLPVVFPALHIAYGLGTLAGVFRFSLTRRSPQRPEKLPPLPGG